jgi:ribosome-binding factor A
MALAHSIQLRYVPELRFYLDDTQDEVDKIEHLFQEIRRRENEGKDRTGE